MPQRKKDELPSVTVKPRYMKRPLFVVGMTFGVCVLVASKIGFHLSVILAILGAGLFLFALLFDKFRHNETLLAVLLSAAAAFCVFSADDYLTVRPLRQMNGQTVTATVQITDEVYETERAVACYATVQEGELPRGTKLLLWLRLDEDTPELYNLATAPLWLTATDDYRDDGVYLIGWAEEDWVVTATDKRPALWWLHNLRRTLLSQVDKQTDGDVTALICAICFGDKTNLSDEVASAFSDAGLSHVMAVSGYHMSVVVMGSFAALCFLGVKRRHAAVITLPITVLFAALTGFTYSAVRAGVMCAVVLAAELFRRKADGKNSLGGAVLLLVAINPHTVCDLGFLLSVSATLGILCVNEWRTKYEEEPISRIRRFGKRIVDLLCVTAAAIVATLPILALTFGRLSVLAPISNLLGVPVVSVIVICGCVGSLLMCVPFLQFVAAPLFLVAGLAVKYLLWLTKTIASLPFAVWLLDRPYLLLWACAVPCLLVAGWWLLRGRGVRVAAAMSVIALCAATITYTLGMRGVTTFTAANMDGGTALLLSRDGYHALILTGEAETADAARFLDSRGIDRLDFVLYTEKKKVAADETIPAEQIYAYDGAGITALGNTYSVNFWGDSTLSCHDGFLTVTAGDTRVLICPSNGDAADLTAAETDVSLLIFDRAVPRRVTALTADRAILCCDEEQMLTLAKAVPWGSYPVDTTGEETVSAMTRGHGDIT